MRVQQINNYSNYNPNFSAAKNTYLEGLFWYTENSGYAKKIENAIKQMPEFKALSEKLDVDIYIGAKESVRLAEDDNFFPSLHQMIYSVRVQYRKQSNKYIQPLIDFFNIQDSVKCLDYITDVRKIPFGNNSGITDKDVNDFISDYIGNESILSLRYSLKKVIESLK